MPAARCARVSDSPSYADLHDACYVETRHVRRGSHLQLAAFFLSEGGRDRGILTHEIRQDRRKWPAQAIERSLKLANPTIETTLMPRLLQHVISNLRLFEVPCTYLPLEKLSLRSRQEQVNEELDRMDPNSRTNSIVVPHT